MATPLLRAIEVEEALGMPLPDDGSEARRAYAVVRDALRAEATARIEALTALATAARQPTRDAQVAVSHLFDSCEDVKSPNCERIAQAAGGVAWGSEKSVSAFAEPLSTLRDAKGRHEIRDAETAVRRAAEALRSARASQEIASRPWAHRDRALELAAAWPNGCATADAPAQVSDLYSDTAPNLRKLTVVIEARPAEALSSQFNYAANNTQRRDLASLYSGIAGGMTGSGIVLAFRNGQTISKYVITNRHVVEHATKLDIVLEGGERLSNVSIAHLDDAYDLAILGIPATARVAEKGGLGFSPHLAHDGEAVVATGYPGLMGSPSFQTTRGFVSNERVLLKNDDGNGLFHVQHSAPIDPGSSGGPLTSEDGKLLGVNAFKMRGRDGVALAVPASALVRALDSVLHPRDEKRAQRKACLALASELASPEPRTSVIRKMLGTEIVTAIGIESYNRAMSRDPAAFERFTSEPLEAISQDVAGRIIDEASYANGIQVFEGCTDTAGAPPSLTFGDGSVRKLRFAREHGRIALMDIELPETTPAPAPSAPAKAPAITKNKKK
ncbi:Serine protease, DegP/HtrA, do-like [Labilithrix luteola]|uniref:Serine protease, DegP/HtrA, do-like n=1 Tax=Labilithrix luteola TaxID=1391654 RepID=A0A0K1PLL7_9BACT|nr:serine protease [Labilithrix luteola]AKU94417.1 Serine protease, DegP/HtrA, do-like [Labilithrix luteola]